MVGNGQWFLPSYGFFLFESLHVSLLKRTQQTGADDRTINLQSMLITKALFLKNWSFRLHEHDKMHSSRIVITHFNQARKNYQMNKSKTKQTLNKNKTRQKAKQTTSDTQITQCGNISCKIYENRLIYFGPTGREINFFFFLIATWPPNFSKW